MCLCESSISARAQKDANNARAAAGLVMRRERERETTGRDPMSIYSLHIIACNTLLGWETDITLFTAITMLSLLLYSEGKDGIL